VQKLEAGLQSRPGNELAGLEGRTELLIRLSAALGDKPDYFGADGRPGNMIGKHNANSCAVLSGANIAKENLQTTCFLTHPHKHPPC
jgi:hypothetical protein